MNRPDIEKLRNYLLDNGYTHESIANRLGVSKSYVTQLLTEKKTFGRKAAEKFGNQFGIRPNWLLTGEGDMLVEQESPHVGYDTSKGIPYYNVDFTMGFDLLVNDQTVTPDYYIDFAPFNRCLCWINARGDSMTPTISAGDIVALQRVEDFRYLISGEVYAIVTGNGLRTIKRVNDKGDSLELIPDNKQYEPQTIAKQDVVGVFYVKGCVKSL